MFLWVTFIILNNTIPTSVAEMKMLKFPEEIISWGNKDGGTMGWGATLLTDKNVEIP